MAISPSSGRLIRFLAQLLVKPYDTQQKPGDERHEEVIVGLTCAASKDDRNEDEDQQHCMRDGSAKAGFQQQPSI